MYNRYIRNDNGSYERIPEEGPQPAPSGTQRPGAPPPGADSRAGGSSPGGSSPGGPPPGGPPPGGPPPGGPPPGGASAGNFRPGGPPPNGRPSGGRTSDGLTGVLQHMLDQFHLDHVDTGDLLLLALLFFLFREDADEELLVALGLLLIL